MKFVWHGWQNIYDEDTIDTNVALDIASERLPRYSHSEEHFAGSILNSDYS